MKFCEALLLWMVWDLSVIGLGGSDPSERQIYYASKDAVARQRFGIDTTATIRFGSLHLLRTIYESQLHTLYTAIIQLTGIIILSSLEISVSSLSYPDLSPFVATLRRELEQQICPGRFRKDQR